MSNVTELTRKYYPAWVFKGPGGFVHSRFTLGSAKYPTASKKADGKTAKIKLLVNSDLGLTFTTAP